MRFLSLSCSTSIVLTALLCFAPALQQPVQAQVPAPPMRGKALFLRCASCHSVVAGGPAKIGPSLAGVVGRKGGTYPGYRYSAAMKAAGPVWDEANLDRWLSSPTKLVPGTSMAFAGMPNPADRQAVITYLRALR